MAPLRALLLTTILVLTPLVGCLGGDDGSEPADPASASPGPDNQTASPVDPSTLDAESTVPAPAWQVGQYFDWSLVNDDFEASWTTVVAEDQGSSWLTLPSDPLPARFEAMFEWYVIGSMAKGSLADEAANGLAFYDFPLSDGKTWESSFGANGGERTLVHEATFQPAIQTANGPQPGYEITATTNGSLYFHYDYVPAIGWFSTLQNHVLPEEGGNGEVDWTYTVTDWGTGYTGTVYTAQAEQILDTAHEIDADADEPGEAEANPNPHASFDVSQDASSLFVVAGALAEAGATRTTLVDPEQNRHELTAMSTGMTEATAVMGHFMDVVPGTWNVVIGGAGADTEGWVSAWQTFDEERVL